MNGELKGIIAALKREPSRTGSLIITFFGDAIVPRGGSVWLGTLLDFFTALDIEGNVVRTAMSRLAADGWFARSKSGRNSFYRLAEKGRKTFDDAMHHVYDPPPPGGLDLLLVTGGGEAARQALKQAGFGSPQPGVWLCPSGSAVPAAAAGALRVPFDLAADDAAKIVSASWPLPEIADAYRRFISAFSPLEQSAGTLAETDAIVARILLVTGYRRVTLADPLLSPGLLAVDWPGGDARTLCRAIYRALLPASEHWLDDHGRDERGPLPKASVLAERFA